MFKDNKYTKTYYRIIENCQSEIGERHHIIPKSMGGSNDPANLVKVSPKAHFILHKLLCKMAISEKHLKSMSFALFQMMNRKVSTFTSSDYIRVRDYVSKSMIKNNPMHDPKIVEKVKGHHRPQVAEKLRGRKRPDQSIVASKRNEIYWQENARPLREFSCAICNEPVTTRVPEQETCSKSCGVKWFHRKKKVVEFCC